MNKLGIFIFFLILSIKTAFAAETANMVKVENYFSTPLTTVGLIDYPPFSRYVKNDNMNSNHQLESALLKPTVDVMKKHGIIIVPEEINKDEADLKLLLLDVRSGKYKLFIGAFANTQLYSGLQMIFPACIGNPIHIITTPENSHKIKSVDDLKNLRGVVSKTEQFSDFIARKISEFGTEYLETPYECYEKLILGEADYMLGGLYYNRMMSSHYGLGSFLSYSQKALFTIPIFIAISKVTPRLSQYMEVFQEEFAKPEYANAVKQEILRIVGEEERKYEGTVPPSFVKHGTEDTEDNFLDVDEDLVNNGRIVEQKVEKKSIDEVLEGI